MTGLSGKILGMVFWLETPNRVLEKSSGGRTGLRRLLTVVKYFEMKGDPVSHRVLREQCA